MDEDVTAGQLEGHLIALRQALIEGEESGVSADFDFDAFIKSRREDVRARRHTPL